MQIIQMSDLHLNCGSNLEEIKQKIGKLSDALKSHLRNDECTVICVLGDIVDKGDASMYKDALEIFSFVKDVFAEFNPTFEFTPGNHDLCDCPYPNPKPENCDEPKCSLEHFVEFAKAINKDYTYANILRKKYDEIDLVLVNSVFHKKCKYGSTDIKSLEDIAATKPALIITHHTFLSENDSDVSAMRNAYKVFEAIEKKEIIGVLHGHTHGYKDIMVGSNCPIIGVGPFLKDVPNVNNQANLVIATETGICRVINYFFREDLGKYESYIIYERSNNVYKGSKIEKVYSEILYDTKKFSVIPNMNLNISMPYEAFNKEIEYLFPKQIEVAKLWQATEVPDTLYYNHGEYMKYGESSAVEFVIAELKSKATSSRAIIPLINFEQVVNSGDGFLPSFDLVQFGFLQEDKKQLYATLYLRALEVNHFFKINLCEIYLMCKIISDQIRSIDSINITVTAFRAQYKENFGCFARAKIDCLGEAKIMALLQTNIDEIINLLIEKRDLSETVIETKGISNLSEALKALRDINPIKANVLDQVENTLAVMRALKGEREKTSNYSSIKSSEKKVAEEFDKTVALFEGGRIYES